LLLTVLSIHSFSHSPGELSHNYNDGNDEMTSTLENDYDAYVSSDLKLKQIVPLISYSYLTIKAYYPSPIDRD